ncbi:MAG TPA: inositol monophosphatase family protein [Xanthomonadaceae bacterium]|nr:inositol monophosphatase family protein [Xanthomonadaceae bacterium]
MSLPDPAFLDRALAVARAAATAADVVVARHYGKAIEVRRKADDSPVTEADLAAERAIRAVLCGAFPDHAIYGEEQGHTGHSPFLWLVDPIDGTRSFVRGVPMFSTQIALMHEGELLLGVSSACAFGETAWARRGGGAFLDGTAVRVSDCADPAAASLSFGNLKSLARGSGWAALAPLVVAAERTRGYGDFYHYHLLARGALDAVIESDVNVLDIAALALIVHEAGGIFTDLAGAAIGLATRSVLAAPPGLHAALLPRLAAFAP